MGTILHPVGPRPARVYWVRRLVVLLALALVGTVIGVGWWLLFGREASGQQAAPTSSGQAVPSAPPESEPAAPTGPVACDAAALAVTLTADARSYPAGSTPTFTLAVTNQGEVSCTLDAGEANREVLVTSGADRIWSSRDCADGTAENLLLLEAGGRYDASVPWGRVRSADGCPADLPEPRAGTYTAVATLLGATSATVVFDLG